MDWEEIKRKIYYRDDSLRDIYIPSTSRDDWKKWVDYVNQDFSIDWFNGRTEKDEKKIDFSIVEEYWGGNGDLCSTAKVFLGNIQVSAHFFEETEIENDIDPKEFNSIEDHEKLMRYMSGLSVLLDREIVLTPEDEHGFVLIKVKNNEEFLFTEGIDPPKRATTWLENFKMKFKNFKAKMGK